MNPLDIIKSVLPFIGTALGGPLGGVAATFIGSKLGVSNATVEAVTNALSGMTPEQLGQFKTAELTFQEHMAGLGYANLKDLAEYEYKNNALSEDTIKEVNATMRSENAAEHWPTYSWRPFIGFCFGFYILSLFILPLCHVPPILLSEGTVLAIGGILGIASYWRGKAQATPDVNDKLIKG